MKKKSNLNQRADNDADLTNSDGSLFFLFSGKIET